EAITQAENAMREQRNVLTRMMTELRQIQENVSKQQCEELEALRRENEELRAALELREHQQASAWADAPAPHADELNELRAGIDDLHRQLQEKDALLHELQEKQANPEDTPQPIGDVDAYEAELNQFRRQLEADRQALNQEIEQMRQRNTELDEATREMELELSRERAELSRERARVDRVREEVRLELDRMQRDNTVRERLAPVNRLKEEMSGRPAADENAGLVARLQGLRGRLTDAPA